MEDFDVLFCECEARDEELEGSRLVERALLQPLSARQRPTLPSWRQLPVRQRTAWRRAREQTRLKDLTGGKLNSSELEGSGKR